MEKLRVNNTPVRTSRNFLINNLEVELEIPQKDEFTNLKIINEKSNIDNNVSNKPLTYGMGKILEELNYETANSKIRIQTSNKKENIQIIYEFDDNNIKYQITELGKVDVGGGGTIAYILANKGIDVIDCGIPILCMHSPYEVASKYDVYSAYQAYKAFWNA